MNDLNGGEAAVKAKRPRISPMFRVSLLFLPMFLVRSRAARRGRNADELTIQESRRR